MSKLKQVAEQILASSEKATPRPWKVGEEPWERAWASASACAEADAGHIADFGAQIDASLAVISVNHSEKLARAVLIMEQALERYSKMELRFNGTTLIGSDKIGGYAIEALAKANEAMK